METREKMEAEKLFAEAEDMLRGIIIHISSKATLPSFLVKNPPQENAFEYVVKELKDEESDAGEICKQYIEYAAEADKLRDAEMEIRRLLDIQTYGLDIDEKAPKKEAKEIVKMYTPALGYDAPPANQDVEESLKEIQQMKHLLDIMEKNIQGKLTEQEIAQMEENSADRIMDIEKLKQMIEGLNS